MSPELNPKLAEYGLALMKYRRGLITHDEMMALADKAEQTAREEAKKAKETQLEAQKGCRHVFASYDRQIGVFCTRCGMRKPDPQ